MAPLELHRQTISTPIHDASLTGEIRAPASHIAPMRLDERRIIGHRAMLELDAPNLIVNLGIGMPEVRPPPHWSAPCCHAEGMPNCSHGQGRLWLHAWAHLPRLMPGPRNCTGIYENLLLSITDTVSEG